jgi:hypothetical protein
MAVGIVEAYGLWPRQTIDTREGGEIIKSKAVE